MSFPFRYNVGGCLQPEALNYVVRSADIDLYNTLKIGEFSYIFSSRQMGKSSLLVRVKQKLQQEGSVCAYLDMTRLGSDGLTQPQWYAGMVMSLLQSLNLSHQVNFRQWWQNNEYLTLVQRLTQLVEEIILPNTENKPLYIFIDEIDSLLSLDFSTDDFFAWMRSCYNQRSQDPRYNHLTFALFGVATPSDLIADKRRTPFNLGRGIPLTGFSLTESEPLQKGLETVLTNPQSILKEILDWTGGQPFLTQKLCDLALKTAQFCETIPLNLSGAMAALWIENLVRSHIINHWESQDEPIHLRTIRDHLFGLEKRTARLLGIYQQLLIGETVLSDDSREQIDLLLSGLVIRQGNQLRIKNRIYSEVFTLNWLEYQLYRLRPYADPFEAWLKSGKQDNSYLLQGQTLLEVERWARDKSLTDLDYQFLSASQDGERKRIQQILNAKQESERFFRELAEAVPQIVWIVEPDGKLSYTNQKGSDFSGFPSDNIQEQQRREVVHPDDYQESQKAWKIALKTGNPYQMQVRMKGTDGNYRWFLNRAVPIHNTEGQVIKWFGTSTDLDEVKQNEEAKRLKEVEARLIEQGKRLEPEKRAIKLQKWLLSSVSVALLVSSTLGILAVMEKRQSAFREVEAIANASEAQFASGNRLDALVTAIKGYNRLKKLWNPPLTLVNQVEQDLKRATWRAVERNRLDSKLGVILGMALSRDGRIATGHHINGSIALWDPKGQKFQILRGHADQVHDLDFSPDGKILVSTGKDGTVRLWDKEGKLLKTLKAHQGRGIAVDISTDGQWIASGGEDNTVKLWTIEGKLVKTLNHDNFVWDVVFSPDSQTLASASWDNTVKIWNLEGKNLKTLKNPQVSDEGENRLVSVTFSPNGRYIVAGDWYGNIFWWNQQGQVLHQSSQHQDAVVSLTFSPDGELLASGSWDNTVKIWNLDGYLIKDLQGHPTGTWEVSFTPDSQTIISGGGDGLVRYWQLQPNSLKILRSHRASVWGVAVTPDGQIWSSSSDGTIKHWDRKGKLLQTLTLNHGEIWSIAVSSDGKMIATTGNDGSLSIWNQKGDLLHEVKNAHQDVVFDVAFNPNSTEIVTVSWDGTVKLWKTEGTLIQTLIKNPERFNAVAFSPDNQWIAAVGDDKMLYLWQRNQKGQFSSQPQLKFKAHRDQIFDVAFTPDSQKVATSSEDKTVKLWDLKGKLITSFQGHQKRVNVISFIPPHSGLPDQWGTVLVSGSWDNSIKLWQLDGTLINTLEGHEARILDLTFSPKNQNQDIHIVSAGLDNVVILWSLNQSLNINTVLDEGCRWIDNYKKAATYC